MARGEEEVQAALEANLRLQEVLRRGLAKLEPLVKATGEKRRHLLDQVLEVCWVPPDPDWREEDEAEAEPVELTAEEKECEETWRMIDALNAAQKREWHACDDAALAATVAAEPDWRAPDFDRVAASVTALGAMRALADLEARRGRRAAHSAKMKEATKQRKVARVAEIGEAAFAAEEAKKQKRKPKDWEPKKSLPVVLLTTGGASPQNCRDRWEDVLKPQCGPWSKHERDRLIAAVEANRGHRWDIVAAFVNLPLGEDGWPTRTPLECLKHFQRHVNPNMRKATWDAADDEAVAAHVRRYGPDHWQHCADAVGRKTADDCRERYVKQVRHTMKPGLNKGNWFPAEEHRLAFAVVAYAEAVDDVTFKITFPKGEKHGFWERVAVHVPTRNAPQCREKWNQTFVSHAPGIVAGEWTQHENDALLKAVEKHGEGNWQAIAAELGGTRTDGQCRVRYTRGPTFRKHRGYE